MRLQGMTSVCVGAEGSGQRVSACGLACVQANSSRRC